MVVGIFIRMCFCITRYGVLVALDTKFACSWQACTYAVFNLLSVIISLLVFVEPYYVGKVQVRLLFAIYLVSRDN